MTCRPLWQGVNCTAWAALLAIGGCGGTTSEVVTEPTIQQYRISRIAVLPFTVEPPTIGQERGYAAPTPPLSVAEKLSDVFNRKLKMREGLAVSPPDEVRDALAALPEGLPRKTAARLVGERLSVDAILVGTVEVYKERAGSAIGLARPQDAAEVGFVVQLVSVKDGAILWTGQYHERQKPANEDLSGFLERGPRYLTVDQLADSAVDHVLRKFPLGRPAEPAAR
jgi:hypothetical protein